MDGDPIQLLSTLLALRALTNRGQQNGGGGGSGDDDGDGTREKRYRGATSKYPTALMYEVRKWKKPSHADDALVERLRKHLADGVDVNARDNVGRTALHHLAGRRRNRAARYLVEHADANPFIEDDEGGSVFSLCCAGIADEQGVGTLALVDWMLGHCRRMPEHAATVEAMLNEHLSSNGKMPSMIALALGNTKANKGGLPLLDIALRHGADPDRMMRSGVRPLHAAVLRNSAPCVLTLLRHGADVNASKADGATPLHLAVLNDLGNMVMLLLKNGADPTVRFGTTLLPRDNPFWANKDAADLAYIEDHHNMADMLRTWSMWDRPAARSLAAHSCGYASHDGDDAAQPMEAEPTGQAQ